jgi:uridine kinase
VTQSQSAFEQLIAMLESRIETSRHPIVLAIDGRSGAGKSTLAAALADRLPSVIVPGDDFFAGGVEISADPPEELARRCIDWQRQRATIEALLQYGRAQYFPFDWDAFDNSLAAMPVVLAVAPLLIIEGVYSARPELADLVDHAIFLDVSEAIRKRRLQAREGEIGAWERQWHRAEDWYFAAVAPPDRFDLVLNANERLI